MATGCRHGYGRGDTPRAEQVRPSMLDEPRNLVSSETRFGIPWRGIMGKRLLKWSGAITLALLAIALIAPQSRYGLIGYLRDERFEEGYPASYWLVAPRDRDRDVREQATICLARTGPEGPQAA